MHGICKNCGSDKDYNFSINMGLCETCIMGHIADLEETVRWMLADIDFRNEGTGIDKEDSPEVAKARKLVE